MRFLSKEVVNKNVRLETWMNCTLDDLQKRFPDSYLVLYNEGYWTNSETYYISVYICDTQSDAEHMRDHVESLKC